MTSPVFCTRWPAGRGRRRAAMGRRMTIVAALACLVSVAAAALAAEEPAQVAARMSDQAFAMLDTLTATQSGGSPSPLLGPIGSFAADSQALVRALKAGDRSAAAGVIVQLQSDRQAIEHAGAAHAAHFDSANWKMISGELDSLAAQIPAATAAPAVSRSNGAGASESGSDLSVTVKKAQLDSGDTLHVTGMIQGRDIKSAGIYRAGRRIARLGVTPDRREQHIALDLHIRDAQPGTVIRVYDSHGHSAQAAIPMPYAEAKAPPRPEVEHEPSAEAKGAGGSTEEIPSATARRSRRPPGRLGSGHIQVTIDSCQLVDPALRKYRLSGRIGGLDLRQAGVYVDGNLARRIRLKSGPGYHVTRFTTSFEMSGMQASLRVYGQGDNFTETPLALGPSTAPYAVSPYGINPYGASPYGASPYGGAPVSVQITRVQQVAPGVTLVNGVIIGRNVVSAGIYQNGVLVQPINVGGLGGLLSNLLPGGTRQIAFSGRFNPARGVAVVRAVDASGAVAQQPVFGGASPYGAYPYGVNPYGASPYRSAPAPYGYGISPPLAPFVGNPAASPPTRRLPW